jgi:hypothetical protein
MVSLFDQLLVRAFIDVLEAVDFFNHLNMLYGTITEFCTPEKVRASVCPRVYL